MATLAHDVYDVHGASSLYIKTCWQNLYRVFPTGGGGDGGVLPPTKNLHIHPLPTKLYTYSLPPKVNLTQYKNKNVIFSCSHCSCTIFVLISYSFETQIMLIFILIDVQY